MALSDRFEITLIALGGGLMFVPTARAQAPAVASDLSAEVAARVDALLPPGSRLDGVTLGCTPPPGATLRDVAPGVSRLASRGFVVMLAVTDHAVACSTTVSAQRQVLVATRDLPSGAPLAPEDFAPQWTDAFAGAAGALTELPAVGDLVAAAAIRSGQPLFAYQMTRPLAIHPGDRVTVMVHNGPVTVRAQLESNSSAAIGDSATVINPESGTPVGVTVTGIRAAELTLP
jgi:flagella basal body P-ring formation protein FlgA